MHELCALYVDDEDVHNDVVTRRMAAAATALAVAGALLVASPAAAVPVPWKNCGTAADPISISRFDASVWPPQRGQPITFTYAGNVARSMFVFENLTISTSSGLNFGVPWAAWLKAGPFTSPPGGVTITVPAFIPAGSVFVLHFTMHDLSGASVFCADATVPIK